MFDAISAASTRKVPEPHMGSAKSRSPSACLHVIPAAGTSLRRFAVLAITPAEEGSRSGQGDGDAVVIYMDVEEQVGTSHAHIEGRRPSVSLKWSTMPSLTLYVTNLEWVKSSLFTVESMANVVSGSHVFPPVDLADYIVEFVGIVRRVNFSMGLRILRAVRQHRLALYIISRSPSKLTMRRPISTFSAPREISSSRSILKGPGRSWQPLKIYFPSCRCSVLLADIGMLFWF